MTSFRFLEIPVTVHPSFLLIALALGWLNQLSGWEMMAAWVVIVFVSVLVHELGHALTARRYGASVAIELNGLGGLTRWGVPEGDLSPGRRALVSAAGSGAGFVLGAVGWLIGNYFGPFSNPVVARSLGLLVFVNFFWGVLNWLPIRPLDGGHLMLSLLEKITPQRADRVARVVFAITSAVALGLAIYFDLIFLAILAGWMLLSEFGIGERRQVPPPDFNYDRQSEEPDTWVEHSGGSENDIPEVADEIEDAEVIDPDGDETARVEPPEN